MPSTGATRDNTLKLLNTVYDKRLRSLIAEHNFLWQWIQPKTVSRAQGEKYGRTLRLSLGAGGVTGSALNLGPPGRPSHEKAYFTYGGHTDQMAIDVQMIEDSANPAAAAKEALEEQSLALAMRFKIDMATILYGDGSNQLAEIVSATDTTHIVVDSLQNLRKGQRVDILLKSSGAVIAGGTAIEIELNRTTKTLTFAVGSINSVADINSNPALYGVYRHGSYPTATNKPIWGFQAALSDNNPTLGGNYGDIDRSDDANEPWRGNVLRNPPDGTGGTPRPLTMALINDALDIIRDRGTGAYDDYVQIVHDKQWAFVINTLVADRRYRAEDVMLMGWAKGVQFAGMPPIIRDQRCPEGISFILCKSDIELGQSHDPKWDDRTGSMLKDNPGSIGYYARWFYRPQLHVGAPCDHAIIRDLAALPAGA